MRCDCPLMNILLRTYRNIHSIEKGALCLLGSGLPGIAGAFYPATVLSKVAVGMPAYDEETFGPVAAIISAKNEKDLKLAIRE